MLLSINPLSDDSLYINSLQFEKPRRFRPHIKIIQEERTWNLQWRIKGADWRKKGRIIYSRFSNNTNTVELKVEQAHRKEVRILKQGNYSYYGNHGNQINQSNLEISHPVTCACRNACRSPCYCCLIIIKVGICRQILVNAPSTKFHEHTFSRSWAVTCGEADR